MTFDDQSTHGEHGEQVSAPRGYRMTPELKEVLEDLLERFDHDRIEAANKLSAMARQSAEIRQLIGFQTVEQRSQICVDTYLRMIRSQALKGGGQSLDDTQHGGAPADLFVEEGQIHRDTQICSAPSPTYTDSIEAAVATRSLLDTITLPRTHKPLRHATREDLAEAALHCQKLASTYGRNARIYSGLASLVPEGKTAGDVLTDAQVRSVRDAC